MNVLRDTMTALIIAGTLLLMVLKINLNVQEHAITTRQSTTTQEHLRTISNVMEYDFHKIGHSLINPFGAIKLAKESHIIFSYDRDPSSKYDSISVEYRVLDARTTPNPNDKLLIRKINKIIPQPVAMGITQFKLRYFNQFGKELPTPVVADSLSKIGEIEITLIFQNAEGFNKEYGRAKYVTRIIPKNLLIRYSS